MDKKQPLKRIFYSLNRRGLLNWMSDKLLIKIRFKFETGYKLNLKNPKTFNEKIQWLKLFYRKDEFTSLVDKYEVKKIVAEKIGEQYVIPTIGIYNSFYEIPFKELPNQFVIKTTHNSGGIVVCKNKQEFNPKLYEEKFKKLLHTNYFYFGREWPYKNVKPRILVEEYMEDMDFKTLPVFKIFCFSGEPKLIQVILNDKSNEETVDYYNINWEKLDIKQNFPNSPNALPKPEKLSEMLSLASFLSKDFPHIRTDFYIINNKIYFSEFTFFSDCGFKKFNPECWDLTLGEWINLPQKNKG